MRETVLDFLFYSGHKLDPSLFRKESWSVPTVITIVGGMFFYSLAFKVFFKRYSVGIVLSTAIIAFLLSFPIAFSAWILKLSREYAFANPGFPLRGPSFLLFPVWFAVGLGWSFIGIHFKTKSKPNKAVQRRPLSRPR